MGTFSRPLCREPCGGCKRGQAGRTARPGVIPACRRVAHVTRKRGPFRGSRVVPRSSRFVFAFWQGRSVFLFPANPIEARELGARGACMVSAENGGSENGGSGGRLSCGCGGCFANLLDSRKARAGSCRARVVGFRAAAGAVSRIFGFAKGACEMVCACGRGGRGAAPSPCQGRCPWTLQGA